MCSLCASWRSCTCVSVRTTPSSKSASSASTTWLATTSPMKTVSFSVACELQRFQVYFLHEWIDSCLCKSLGSLRKASKIPEVILFTVQAPTDAQPTVSMYWRRFELMVGVILEIDITDITTNSLHWPLSPADSWSDPAVMLCAVSPQHSPSSTSQPLYRSITTVNNYWKPTYLLTTGYTNITPKLSNALIQIVQLYAFACK